MGRAEIPASWIDDARARTAVDITVSNWPATYIALAEPNLPAGEDMLKIELFLALIAAVTSGGCSSEDDILPKKDRFSRPGFDAGADVTADAKPPRDPNANCVKPGTPNNERGIGGYCETGAECPSDVGPRFCTADFRDIGVIDDDKWFCSMLCNTDDECGTGARCVTGISGRGCSPIPCTGDAGSSLVQGAGR
jgi:hypothetical protein